MIRSLFVATVVLVCTVWTPRAVAQTVVSADGVIESTVGGFRFPDGTMQATAAVGGAPVEDTGRTECYATDGSSRDCTGTGEDGELQAGVSWPTPRFADNGNGTVTDNLTGLIWLKDANCPAGDMTWQQALDWVAVLNSTSIACTDYPAMTFADWRMPNIKELLSLVDYSQSGPALPSGHPFTSVQTSFYWSSSSVLTTPSFAWNENLANGFVGTFNKSNAAYYVWPVRGGQ